jgi:hypothetical protein
VEIDGNGGAGGSLGGAAGIGTTHPSVPRWGGGGSGTINPGACAPSRSGGNCGGGAGGPGAAFPQACGFGRVGNVSGAGGGGGGGYAGGGGGGGGRSNGPVPANPGNPGTSPNPSTFNSQPVTPGASYPITAGSPGGSVVISWNPQ